MSLPTALLALALAAGATYPQGTNALRAIEVPLGLPSGLAVDARGNLYFADTENAMVLRVSPDGMLTAVAGNGVKGFSGDGRLATTASLGNASGRHMGVAVDAAGNVFIADWGNDRVRMVTTSGTITSVGVNQQTLPLRTPSGVALDAAGNLFVADTGNDRVRKLTPAGVFTTVAGAEVFGGGFYGDGGPATSAVFQSPTTVVVDPAGNLYIADTRNSRVRKVTPAGIITTIAGDGQSRPGADGGPATNSSLWDPMGIAVDAAGNLYIADRLNQRVRKVTPAGIISTVAGNGRVLTGGVGAFSGDGGPATSASLNLPEGVAVDTAGNLYITDTRNSRIRKVTASGIISTVAGNGERGRIPIPESGGGIISTVAGNGKAGFSGDSGPATSASLSSPAGLAADLDGNLFVADKLNHRIRKVAPDGIITTVAGNGQRGFSGDGGPAASASLDTPSAVAVDPNGNLFIADLENNRIRKVSPDGTIITVAGKDNFGWSGDGGPATSATLSGPSSLAIDASGNLYFTQGGNRVRRVSTDGVITLFAGHGGFDTPGGFAGDGGPAVEASLKIPEGVAVDAAGNVYIADTYNDRVRKVSPDGIINTIAGNQTHGYASEGDGGPATNAPLAAPTALAVSPSGNLYILNRGTQRIREVTPGGMISTVAGTGIYNLPGDGAPAANAGLSRPSGIAADAAGNLYIAEEGAHRVRKVTAEASAQESKPVIQSVVNGASYQAGIAASTWITINGTNLSQTTRSWKGTDFVNSKLPAQLDSVRVLVNGKPAYVYYISPTQINALAGADDTEGAVPVEAVTAQGRSDPFLTQKAKFSPGLFAFSVEGGRYVIAHTPDGSFIGRAGLVQGLQTRPVKPGEVITIYGTGFGPTNPGTLPENVVTQPAAVANSVTVRIGNRTADVSYSGLIGSGLYQLNLTVPDVPDADQLVVAEVGGFRSQNNVVIPVRR